MASVWGGGQIHRWVMGCGLGIGCGVSLSALSTTDGAWLKLAFGLAAFVFAFLCGVSAVETSATPSMGSTPSRKPTLRQIDRNGNGNADSQSQCNEGHVWPAWYDLDE
jgi:hypothetical protein